MQLMKWKVHPKCVRMNRPNVSDILCKGAGPKQTQIKLMLPDIFKLFILQ